MKKVKAHVKAKTTVQGMETITHFTVPVGTKISSQDPQAAILATKNTRSGPKEFVARVFYSIGQKKWLGSVTKKGLIVYIDKEPAVGQRIEITEDKDRFAIGKLID
jgi:hypothetical protein